MLHALGVSSYEEIYPTEGSVYDTLEPIELHDSKFDFDRYLCGLGAYYWKYPSEAYSVFTIAKEILRDKLKTLDIPNFTLLFNMSDYKTTFTNRNVGRNLVALERAHRTDSRICKYAIMSFLLFGTAGYNGMQLKEEQVCKKYFHVLDSHAPICTLINNIVNGTDDVYPKRQDLIMPNVISCIYYNWKNTFSRQKIRRSALTKVLA